MNDVFELSSESQFVTRNAIEVCVLFTILLPMLLIVNSHWYYIILIACILVFIYFSSWLIIRYKSKSKLEFRVDFSKRILTKIKKKKNVEYDLNFLIEISPITLPNGYGSARVNIFNEIELDFGRKGKVKIKSSYDNYEEFFSKLVFYCKENEITIHEDFSYYAPAKLRRF